MDNEEAGVQLRHSEWGLFQGSCMGLAFWHPMSEMPEQGIFRFESVADAKGFVAECQRYSTTPQYYANSYFTFEPFDKALSDQLEAQGLAALNKAGAMV